MRSTYCSHDDKSESVSSMAINLTKLANKARLMSPFRVALLTAFAGGFAMLAACRVEFPVESEPYVAPIVGPERVAEFMEKAHALAEEELAKFNEIERTYMGASRLYRIPHPALIQMGVYVKLYREFTSCEVEDILLTRSLRYPIAYRIRFDYEIYATYPRHVINDKQAKQKSLSDTEFSVLRDGQVRRRYKVDAQGNYKGDLPRLPKPEGYYGQPIRPPEVLGGNMQQGFAL
jgi:hypothetical protein